MKYSMLILAGVIAISSVGCNSFEGRVPSKAISKPNGPVVYFTKRDSIPKDAVYRPYVPVKTNGVSAQMIDPAIVSAVVAGIPKITDSIFKTRNNIILSDTELYISGVSNITPDEIQTMINSLKSNIDSAK